MIKFIHSLMTDKRSGAVWAPIKSVLYLLSLVYGLVILCRKILYKLKIFRSHRVQLKVVSIGNLTLGGTGKTPFAIALAGIMEDEMRSPVALLIRGYGWDEQALLKKNLPDTPILVGEDRVKSAHKAIRLYGSQFAVLDDGFQHWEIERDLDIVLIDSRNPFGNNRLFPRGVLREPKKALKRADVVVFTKIDAKGAGLDIMRDEISRMKSSIIFLEAVHRPSHLYDPRVRKDRDLLFLRDKKVILVSSIGDPEYFEQTVKSLGATILDHMVFNDHHDFKEADIKRILKMCGARAPDFMVTTEKDAVKFARMSFSFGNYTMMTLAIRMDITSGREQLIDRLRSVRIR
ncbi:MAG: tetraacyldisaccharide 4'-kinase [Candidatus Omnitrophica bacterium]|nr:tetraacyldisaccharide 4'-kinase [Candidatus Omnitrophota bacterium]MBU0881062.1 tetraacyldisaccharide 4'-kinase [Candidatus Omnitrophota bacterium]MBU1808624.1 tetraacyldisaccharide 4'-kinase [Candidatus Omnitrophota bacterium]